MDPETVRICVGCEVPAGGGWGIAEAIAGIGALTGLVGAYAGIQAFVVADRALRSGILREEFAGHRLKLETNLTVLERSLVSLEQSANVAMPFPRLEANFAQAYNDTSRAVATLAEEAARISQRGLFQGNWGKALVKPAASVEREWDSVSDPSIPQGIRRASAKAVVDQLKLIVRETRTMIEDTVKAPLREGLFGRRRS